MFNDVPHILEVINDRIQALDGIQSYIGTFFSKEWVLKHVLRMNDGEIADMRDQIATEAEKDPMDGGVPNDGGDGIQRYPSDSTGAAVDPEMDAGDRARMQMGIPPEGEEEEPPPE